MRKTVIICDCCGRQKGETNHWFRVFVYTTAICISPLASFPEESGAHLCGESCVSTLISQHLKEIVRNAEIVK